MKDTSYIHGGLQIGCPIAKFNLTVLYKLSLLRENQHKAYKAEVSYQFAVCNMQYDNQLAFVHSQELAGQSTLERLKFIQMKQ